MRLVGHIKKIKYKKKKATGNEKKKKKVIHKCHLTTNTNCTHAF